jgi:hypothetical protein
MGLLCRGGELDAFYLQAGEFGDLATSGGVVMFLPSIFNAEIDEVFTNYKKLTSTILLFCDTNTDPFEFSDVYSPSVVQPCNKVPPMRQDLPGNASICAKPLWLYLHVPGLHNILRSRGRVSWESDIFFRPGAAP